MKPERTTNRSRGGPRRPPAAASKPAGDSRGPRPWPPATPRRAPRPALSPIALAAPESTRALLAAFGERAGELEEKLTKLVRMILDQNALFNLTGDTLPIEQWHRHVEDALHCALLVESKLSRPGTATRIADAGSGGGMPGLIWGILWPEAHIILIEAVEKKAHFLRRCRHALGLTNLQAINDRLETLGQAEGTREQYDLVSARALAPLPVLAEFLLPLVKPGGYAIAIKGGDIAEEMKSAKRAIKLLGGSNPADLYPYERADGKAGSLIVIHKTGRTPSTYPRRIGMPAKNPL